MPLLVDSRQRRGELLAATWRVVLARGLEGTTARAIADEAGCSLSALAHVLGGKHEILVAAQTAVHERIAERAFAFGGDLYGLAALRAALEAALPLDAERTADAHVNMAFAGAALSNPCLAKARRGSAGQIRALLRMVLAEARSLDELRHDIIDEDVVDDFIVVTEGSTLLTLADDHECRCVRLQRIATGFVERLRAR
jgi:AcrR family transcriptional regulator